MNILNLLTKEKSVAGIEISDSVVRIAFFRTNGKGRKSPPLVHLVPVDTEHEKTEEVKTVSEGDEELVLIEEPIASNIIADGVVVDIDLLAKTLKSIWAKANLGTDYAIVAIPDDKIYSRIFSFPKSVEGARLSEAMRLAISFQLPMKTEDMYLDWERTAGTSTTNEILFSTIPRAVAEGYVKALEKAGIKTLALESHLASIARAVKLPPGQNVLFTKKTPDGATLFVLKDNILRFSRTLPSHFVPENQIESEIRKVKEAFSAEEKEPIVEQDLLTASVRDEYALRSEITEPKAKWLVALGTAIRSKIPAGEDNLVSLLPIGTEEAYSYQRATTFIVLMRNLTIGVSIFFILAYASAYLFMLSLSENTAKQITMFSVATEPVEVEAMEKKISEVNAKTEAGALFLGQTSLWSILITELVSKTPDGITLSMFSAPNVTDVMSITGMASNRTTLNNYKKILQESSLFSNVELPLTNLEKKEAIPFTMSFRLKDPSALSYSNQIK